MGNTSVTKYYSDGVTTVAKLSNTKSMFEEIQDRLGAVGVDVVDIVYNSCTKKKDLYKRENRRKSYIGKSVCDGRDTFDEAFGRKLASLKADKKYHADILKQYEGVLDILSSVYFSIDALWKKHKDCYIKLDNKISEITEV